MPDAYEDNMASTHSMEKLNDASVTTTSDISYFTYDYDSRTMSTTGSSSLESPGSHQMETYDILSPREIFDILGDFNSDEIEPLNDKTDIEIMVQPVDKFRFRYKSEMTGTHGRLLGDTSETSRKKEFPTVKLINCHEDDIIRCTLVTVDEEKRLPHAHHLVKKYENVDNDDPHDIKVSAQNNYTAEFRNMGIIHTAKKDVKEEFIKKRKIEILDDKRRRSNENPIITTNEEWEIKIQAKEAQKSMNLNSVCLCFQGFRLRENNVLYPITDKIYSRPINNLKSVKTGELKICRIDKHTSSCKGNEEVWLLVEKVDKKNIKVKFYEVDDDDNLLWEADGKFSVLDVHHQYAIVVKTPSYKNTDITESVDLFVRLERPSDGEVSNSIKFVYKASEKNSIGRKRPRIASASASLEMASNTKPAEQLPNNFISEPLEEILPADEISGLSQELQKLNNENENTFNIQEGEDFSNTSDSDTLITLTFAQDEENGECYLVGDGVASNSMINCQDFATESMKKIRSIYKEMKSNGKTQCSMMDIKNLLQETVNSGDTPLMFALRTGQFEVAKCILECIASNSMFKSVINQQNDAGKTPLHVASYQDHSEIVRILLKLGADPNICDDEDATPLHAAVMTESNSSIHELLQSSNNLNLEAHNESGCSALHLAAKVGSLSAVKALVNAGADVNGTDMSYGRTALHIAVESSHTHIVTYLLTETKIKVNAKNLGGNTALHSAVVMGGQYAEELVKILKEHGADPNIRNNNGSRREEKEEDHMPPLPSAMDQTLIEIENSDGDEEIVKTGESSFDLARDDPKLMQLLGQQKSSILSDEKKLDSKEEFYDEMMQQGDEKVTDMHIHRISVILDRTNGWKKLAQHTKNAALMQLHRMTSSPSSALLNQIRHQKPELTVSQLKKLLMEVQAYEAAIALNQN